MNHRYVDALQAAIGPVAGAARKPREPLIVGVVPKARIETSLPVIAVSRCRVAELAALEPAPRDDVEHAVRAVAVVGGETSALGLQIVDVLRVELRTDGGKVAV